MRKKDYTVYVVLFLTLAIIVVFTVYMAGKKPAYFNWNKTYEDGLVEPYDVGIFREVLKKKSVQGMEESKTGFPTLPDGVPGDSATYVFIGRYCYLGKKQVEKLLEYAFSGHDVLLVAEGVPDTLLQALSYYAKPVSYSRFDENKVHVRASRKNTRARSHHFRFRGFDQDTLQATDWYYLDEGKQLDYFYGGTGNRYIRRSYVNDRLNYAQFKVGNGFIYLHTSPVLFSNFALRRDSAFYYLNDVFEGIYTGRIVYDTYSRTYRDDAEPIKRQSDSPLSYILKQPALKWAWYIFLATVLLFFLLRARRTQRIIPVLEQKRNTSVNFLDTMSGLFYHHGRHRQMAETKMNLFLSFIRSRLGISTQQVTEQTLRQIAVKSKIPEYEVIFIFDYYRDIVQDKDINMKAEQLMEFCNSIDRFYQSFNKK